ncbi:MAG: glycosyltransferase, partial [Acidobacteriota bacterium]
CAGYQRIPQPALRARLAPNGESIVMHVSNFRPVKRVDSVLDVFLRLRKAVPAKLVMIGDGPQRQPLERRVVDEGLLSDVTFVREQQDLVPWLSVADLFLLPSSSESFGMAALEAMACEVPVVASRIGGLPEVIEDGETGFLCALDDIDHMVARGESVLKDPQLRQRIGRAAANHVRTHFCADVIVPRYEAYYEEVLKLESSKA